MKGSIKLTVGLLLPCILGYGQFSSQNTIAIGTGATVQLHSADLDQDDDNDLVAVIDSGRTVLWYKNSDGLGTMVFGDTIASGLSTNTKVALADFDGDGSIDAAIASTAETQVFWKANDGDGMFGPAQFVNLDIPIDQIFWSNSYNYFSLVAADLVGDTMPELLINGDSIFWVVNDLGLGFHSSGSAPPFTPDTIRRKAVLLVGDMDLDGDKDIITHRDYLDGVLMSENIDGNGETWAVSLISPGLEAAPKDRNMQLLDVDGDGDLDIMGQDHYVFWCRNLAADGQLGQFERLRYRGMHDGFNIGAAGHLGCDHASIIYNGRSWSTFQSNLGNFSPLVAFGNTPYQTTHVVLAELNGDGRNDLVHARPDSIFWRANTIVSETATAPQVYLNGNPALGGSLFTDELPATFTSSSEVISVFDDPNIGSPSSEVYISLLGYDDYQVGDTVRIIASSASPDSCASHSMVEYVITTPVGLETNEMKDYFVFPNPNNGQFEVVLDGTTSYQATRMVDLQGRLVLERQVTGERILIDGTALTCGVYILQLQNENGWSAPARVVLTEW